MRRQDKQISDPILIEKVMEKGTVVHIAMMDGYKPYQIPLNYGIKSDHNPPKFTEYIFFN